MKNKEEYPIRKTNYDEIMHKKLEEFYVVVQIVSVVLPIGEGNILEKSKIYMMFGIDIIRKKNNNRIV